MRKTSYALWYAVLRFHPFVTKLTSSIQNWSEPTYDTTVPASSQAFLSVHSRSISVIDTLCQIALCQFSKELMWVTLIDVSKPLLSESSLRVESTLMTQDYCWRLSKLKSLLLTTVIQNNLTWTISIHDRLFRSVLNHLNYLVNFVVNSWHNQTLYIYR